MELKCEHANRLKLDDKHGKFTNEQKEREACIVNSYTNDTQTVTAA